MTEKDSPNGYPMPGQPPSLAWMGDVTITTEMLQNAVKMLAKAGITPYDMPAVEALKSGQALQSLNQTFYPPPLSYLKKKEDGPSTATGFVGPITGVAANGWPNAWKGVDHSADYKNGDTNLVPPYQETVFNTNAFPPEHWCYEIQCRLPKGKSSGDSETWYPALYHPNRYSTERRAENRVKRILKERQGKGGAEFRVEPIFLGYVPDFRWERSAKTRLKREKELLRKKAEDAAYPVNPNPADGKSPWFYSNPCYPWKPHTQQTGWGGEPSTGVPAPAYYISNQGGFATPEEILKWSQQLGKDNPPGGWEYLDP